MAPSIRPFNTHIPMSSGTIQRGKDVVYSFDPNIFGYGDGRNQAAGICIFIIAILAPFAAASQDGVSCGMVETAQGPQYWGACPKPSQTPQGGTHDKFLAIALSPSTMKTGTAWDYASLSEAERWAHSECASEGATDCRNIMWSKNSCIAVATGKGNNSWGADWDVSRAGAQAKALAGCRGVKHQICEIQESACMGDKS
jgi:Domain of unknown function (DUF4189)